MNFFRKSLKAYIIASMVFLVMSLLLACIVSFTGFKESWTFMGLILILSVTALFLGMMQGAAAGRKGLIIGMASAAVFVASLVIAAGSIFADSFDLDSKVLFYLIPIFMGGAGGIAGVGKYNK